MSIFDRIQGVEITNPERFKEVDIDNLKSIMSDELDFIKKQVDGWLSTYSLDEFPSPSGDEDNCYNTEKNDCGWTQGFFTGVIWLLYEWTGEEKYKEAALAHVENFKHRIDENIEVDHHDLGFLYSLSCVACYKLTKDEKAKETALKAADKLAFERYMETTRAVDRGRLFQIKDNHSVFIIDCSMNVPLMYWATEVTGNPIYAERAYNHMLETVDLAIRDNCSCYQGITKDIYTGELVKKDAGQGYNDDSYWARGHAWALYGTILSYKYTKDIRFLELCKKLTNFYINHLPSDDICNWDMIFTDDDTTKDTSAATTAICGILELAKQLPLLDKDRELYQNVALNMMKTLIEKYSAHNCDKSNGLLLSGVYVHSINDGKRVRHARGEDTVCIWGDYFYMEAIMRVMKSINIYW